MKTYLLLRAAAPLLLVIQLGIRLVRPEPSVLPDLAIFNLAVFLAALSAYLSPLFNDRWAVAGITGAIGIWAIGSTISTAESFYNFHIWRGFSDVAYALFYLSLIHI